MCSEKHTSLITLTVARTDKKSNQITKIYKPTEITPVKHREHAPTSTTPAGTKHCNIRVMCQAH